MATESIRTESLSLSYTVERLVVFTDLHGFSQPLHRIDEIVAGGRSR